MIRSPFIACPVCRSTADIRVSELVGTHALVTCKRCYEPGGCIGSGDDRTQAVESWNARAIADNKARALCELPTRETNIGRLALLVGAGYTGNEAGLLLREMGFTVPSGSEVRA